MKEVSVLGIDLAKNHFSLCGVDEKGQEVFRKSVRRNQLVKTVIQVKPKLVVVEACGGAHHWCRVFTSHDLKVKMIAPKYVKPYVKSQKNDHHDASAIAEAATRPHMRFVPQKQIAHQDIQCTHRIRFRLIQNRTRLCNEIRSFLMEYGIVLPLGVSVLQRELSLLCGQPPEHMSSRTIDLFRTLYEELVDLQERIKVYDQKIDAIVKEHKEVCTRLMEIPGVGPITATAVLSTVSDPHVFQNGRHLAAYLGLVPRQVSTGGKTVLRGITKHGDCYLRTLLIHGARTTLRHAVGKKDKQSLWIQEKIKTRGSNKACVAAANKTARILWNMLAKDQTYRKAA